MKNALFRLSKYSGDKNVFNDYTINALQQTASQMDGYLNYACALGGQNGIPTLVFYADHTIHAITRRTGIQYSYAIIAMLLERLEMKASAKESSSCRKMRQIGHHRATRNDVLLHCMTNIEIIFIISMSFLTEYTLPQ